MAEGPEGAHLSTEKRVKMEVTPLNVLGETLKKCNRGLNVLRHFM